ncbi:PREDICTED: uncharacterized protein LOC104803108 [Tarenaya hassleriana]|uniref:uncharacterized protein LOC104803108 n=1 Tax=Tarenaya hassleriana TaxID=28532 RepID=UPI00053C1934|nr:PREDICTED: uncharacterized protein LOC104803108 [Tarenaya hassleriana]
MLQIVGRRRSRSGYQKLTNEKPTRRKRHFLSAKKPDGRPKGFRLNRPGRLVLKALASTTILPRRIMSIYARLLDQMNREGLYPNLILSSQWGFPVFLKP